MKTLVSFCKLESDVLAKFTIRLKSQSEQYKAITLRNVIDGSVLEGRSVSSELRSTSRSETVRNPRSGQSSSLDPLRRGHSVTF